MRLKYRNGDSFASLPMQSPIYSTWVDFGTVLAYSTVVSTADLSTLKYTVEPQAWFQPYQGASCVSIWTVSALSCELRAYNPTNAAAHLTGWLKTCEYFRF
mgnify:CR=1 FL=1